MVLVLVGSICLLLGPPSEVAQGPLIELLLCYLPSEWVLGDYDVMELHLLAVALVEGRTC